MGVVVKLSGRNSQRILGNIMVTGISFHLESCCWIPSHVYNPKRFPSLLCHSSIASTNHGDRGESPCCSSPCYPFMIYHQPSANEFQFVLIRPICINEQTLNYLAPSRSSKSNCGLFRRPRTRRTARVTRDPAKLIVSEPLHLHLLSTVLPNITRT